MALSKPLFSSHLKSLHRLPIPSSLRLLSFATPEEAAAERRRKKRQIRIEPPISSVRQPLQQQKQQEQRVPSKSPRSNPNAPKFPEPLSALSGPRLNLHNRILSLVREGDLNEASLLVRHSIYSNCRPTVFTCNAVLSALLRASRYSDLLSLHRFITLANVAPTVITHNLLLQAYCDCRKTDTALENFRLLLKDDSLLSPSPSTYRILVKGLLDNSKLPDAVSLKNDMPSPDPTVYNLLMSGFLKKDDPDSVIALFDELQDKLGDLNDGIVYGNLMKAYFKKGSEEKAMEVYARVLGDGSAVRFNAVSYNMVLDALGSSGKLAEVVELFGRMCREHEPPKRIAVNMGSFNVMVDAYCAEKKFGEAVGVFRRMGEKKCSPDTLSYNNLICQLGGNGLVDEAEELYREMGEREIDADEYTYVLLVEACFGAGRVDDATAYFKKMVELGLKPNANSYNKVIGGLVNVGRLDEAREFFDLMVEKEVKPNVASYELLGKAFCEAGRLDDALKTVKGIVMDDNVSLSDEMKEVVEAALKKEGREAELGTAIEEAEKEKAEALARAAEEKARAEALAKEEEERKKAEAAAEKEAAAKASAAALEAILGRKKPTENKEDSKGLFSLPELGSAEQKKDGDASAADSNATDEGNLELKDALKGEVVEDAEQESGVKFEIEDRPEELAAVEFSQRSVQHHFSN